MRAKIWSMFVALLSWLFLRWPGHGLFRSPDDKGWA